MQQETSMGVINLDPLIVSLEEALSICHQRRRARAVFRTEQEHYRPLQGWRQLLGTDFHLPSLQASIVPPGRGTHVTTCCWTFPSLELVQPSSPRGRWISITAFKSCCWLLLTTISVIKVPMKTVNRTQIAN